MAQEKEGWGTRIGLVLAMAGTAVGLGNFLRFPMQAVQNGGGAFILPYLVCLLLIGLPLLWIEWAAGRYGGRFGAHTPPYILDAVSGGRPFWRYFGVLGIFINIAVAGYYCYIESWTLAYTYHALAQSFSGLQRKEVADFFVQYVDTSDPVKFAPSLLTYLFCLILNVYVLSRGLTEGVEKMARWGMPILLIFGAGLAIQTLLFADGQTHCPDCGVKLGLNFLWEPDFKALTDPKVWLAAAGQICFTLGVGMGCLHTLASYVKPKDDIALNALSAGWLNTFVEVVLGAAIVIPISTAFLGLTWVKQNAGFAMGFQTLPYLFAQWGPVQGTAAGVMWFGLLFFAGITSSLAMGTPWMSFMEDEFDWSRKKSAWSFGALALFAGLPTVLLFNEGVFDEFDYWAGSVALLLFAVGESYLFSYIFGINKGWNEIHTGADIQIPVFFRFIIKYVTPLLLLLVFLGATFKPVNNDWTGAFKNGWTFDPSSLIGKLTHNDKIANRAYFADYVEADADGYIVAETLGGKTFLRLTTPQRFFRTSEARVVTDSIAGSVEFDSLVTLKSYALSAKSLPLKSEGPVKAGERIAQKPFGPNPIFYIEFARAFMLGLFLFLIWVVYLSDKRRVLKGVPNYTQVD